MIICVDFDGTCVTHEYPNVGRNIGAEIVLKELVELGHQIILWTMRSGAGLEDAVQWFNEHDIPLLGVNSNPDQPSWTTSPKAYAQLYIDDAAFGAPLLENPEGKPYIDWSVIQKELVK